MADDVQCTPKFNLPVLFYTSLKDTFPKQSLQALHLEHVNGIKILYRSGQFSSYFEYEADHPELIRTIGSLSFALDSAVAGTTCHAMPFDYIRASKSMVPAIECEHAAFFWSVSEKEYVAYTCLKSPYKHTLLLNKNSKRVLHRIEFTG